MIIDRRKWLIGGAALATTFVAGCAQDRMLTPRRTTIGIQLYTLRDLFATDPMGTLEKIAAIGYREVEFGGGGYDAMNHKALRKTMDRLNLTAPSLHISYDALTTKLDASIAMAKTLGADTVVLPYIGAENRTAANWRNTIASFNHIAATLKRTGLGFAYHNHDFEFTEKVGEQSLYDILIADRDPALVRLELDLFWMVTAGVDPKALIRRLPGAIYAYYVKDRTTDGKMASVGNGTIDFADIFTLNHIAGVQHFYVENDLAPAPYLPDITTSFATLNRLRLN